jgi:hypothetical protein
METLRGLVRLASVALIGIAIALFFMSIHAVDQLPTASVSTSSAATHAVRLRGDDRPRYVNTANFLLVEYAVPAMLLCGAVGVGLLLAEKSLANRSPN